MELKTKIETMECSTRTATAACGCLLLLVACGCQPSKPDLESVDAAATLPQVVVGQTPSPAQQDAMLAAKDALFERLSGRLMEVISDKGPAAAIAVCKEEAPQIAAEIGEAHGLRIGRTGVRLRNPENQAPAWAAAFTQDKVAEPQFVSLDNGEAAALLPIKLQAKCLMCHGPQEQIVPMVSEQLSRLYPNDQATGFEEGELRGWFWVELPAG